MKNKSCIAFAFIFIIMMSCLNCSYSVTISDDEFKANFLKDIEGKDDTATFENNEIIFISKSNSNSNEKNIVKYTLGETPTFECDIKFNDAMTYSQYKFEALKYTQFSHCLTPFEKYMDTDIGFSNLYFWSQTNDKFTAFDNVFEESFTGNIGLDAGKKDFKDKIVNDNAFELKFETVKETENEIELKGIMKVKLKKDNLSSTNNTTEAITSTNFGPTTENVNKLPNAGFKKSNIRFVYYFAIIGSVYLLYRINRKK